MNIVNIKSDNHIKIAEKLFSYIDSSISSMFKNNISSAISAYLLFDNNNGSAFFCYESDDTVYIYISCSNETDDSSRIICNLFREDFFKHKSKSIEVWIRNENQKTINLLKSKFPFDETAYGMTEFIMKRKDFSPFTTRQKIITTGYKDEHIDLYLDLLNRAMTYHQDIAYYSNRRKDYQKKFSQRNNAGYFKAFWHQTKLIGLYLRGWKYGNEIELLAVEPKLQREGYGSYILNYAINELFTTTEKEAMYLYCVDHNKSGQSFYRKAGMHINGHSYKMTL